MNESDKLCSTKCVFHADTHEGYCDRLEKLEKQMGDFVLKLAVLIESFSTVRLVVYSGVGLTLATVFGAVIALVLKR